MNLENNIVEKFRATNNNIDVKIKLNGVIVWHTDSIYLIAGSLTCKVPTQNGAFNDFFFLLPHGERDRHSFETFR
jgi:hypothetical protein